MTETKKEWVPPELKVISLEANESVLVVQSGSPPDSAGSVHHGQGLPPEE